jgi:hypothetical protein
MFVKSNEFKEALKEIFEIEKVLETCFSNYNQIRASTALIKKSDENKFLLTNDGLTILNTLGVKNWLIKNYLFKYLNKHSSVYGDNCKVFYFFICEFLRYLTSNHEDKWSKYRFVNLSQLYESISKKFTNSPGVHFIENLNEILDENLQMLVEKTEETKLSVLNDLKIERNFKIRLNSLIIEMIRNNLKEDINLILDNLKHILYFTKSCCSPNEAKLYKNGFFINRSFQINNLKNYNRLIKAVFIDNSLVFALNEAVTIRNSSLDELANLSLFNNQNIFREFFIKNLKDFNIDFILTIKPLNDWQKSQLNRLNCSVVSYLDEEYVDYLCFKLRINKISCISDFNEKNILNLNKIELILEKNHEILYFFQLDNPKFSLYFAHIDVLLDSFQQQIKSHYLKVLKTIRLLSQNKRLITCSMFEKLFICGEYDSSNEFNQDFYHIFKNINRNFNRNEIIKMTSYEPFELKMRCLFGTLELMKQLFNLDDIIYIRSTKSIEKKNYEEEED